MSVFKLVILCQKLYRRTKKLSTVYGGPERLMHCKDTTQANEETFTSTHAQHLENIHQRTKILI